MLLFQDVDVADVWAAPNVIQHVCELVQPASSHQLLVTVLEWLRKLTSHSWDNTQVDPTVFVSFNAISVCRNCCNGFHSPN